MAPSAIFSRCRHASPPSRLRERVGVRASALALTRSLRDSTSPATRERLASSELQQLDGVVVLHAAADALRRVEQHVGLRRVGIAQDAHAGPIDDEIAAAEVAEGDREGVRGDVRHVLGLDHREGHQRRRLAGAGRRLPEVVAVGVLELADRGLRLAVHDEGRVLAVAGLQRVDEVDELVGRAHGREGAGIAGAFPAVSPSDKLVDLVYALKAGYRQNASFVMNRKTQAAIRKFKDADGNYLWQPPAGAGQPATLMSFPVVAAAVIPDIAANSLSIAFGDFRRGYLVVDRAGVRVLRDPYSAKPYVLFYTTKRVGGGVQDYDAIKLLKFA